MNKTLTFQLIQTTHSSIKHTLCYSFSEFYAAVFCSYISQTKSQKIPDHVLYGSRPVPQKLISYYHSHPSTLHNDFKMLAEGTIKSQSSRSLLYTTLIDFIHQKIPKVDKNRILYSLPQDGYPGIDALVLLWTGLIWYCLILDSRPPELRDWIQIFWDADYCCLNHNKSLDQADEPFEETQKLIDNLRQEPFESMLDRTRVTRPVDADKILQTYTEPKAPPVATEPVTQMNLRIYKRDKQLFDEFCKKLSLTQREGFSLLLDKIVENSEHIQEFIANQNRQMEQIKK